MKESSFKDFILDQLNGLEELTCKRMFGAYGLYQGHSFFGIIAQDALYFKTDDSTRKKYIRAGMKPFSPTPKQTLKNYFQVPARQMEDRDELMAWARESAHLADKVTR